MDATIIQAITTSGVNIVLIYLLVRAEQRNKDLMGQICDITAQHAKDILQLTIEFANKLAGSQIIPK